ncbi:MAG TPA: hypothetical protein DHU59_05950 [Clostridiales bacterium]|nr:hypothetical protein [Clostridiales bacterium]
MKKNKDLVFTRILYVLFVIATIISLFIVYKDVNGNIAFKFITGYVFFTFFFIIYISIITILNSRKLKWIEIRKRLFKFIILFVIFGASNYSLDFIFRPAKIDLYREFSIALAFAFGISFVDVIFFKSKEN